MVSVAAHDGSEWASTVVDFDLVLAMTGGVDARLPQTRSLRQARAQGPERGLAAGKPPSPAPLPA